MLFSVCIPVYNTSKYLDECLRSVLIQTEKDYEIVLVDDGSTDDSGEICDRYAAQYPNIRVIHKENEGLMMTRRRGFREAKGDYFICVDSDDKLFDSRALERIYNTIATTGCDMVLYNYVYGAGGGRGERTSCLFDYETDHVFEGETKKHLYEKLLTSNNMNNMWIKCPSRHVVDIDVDYSQWKKTSAGQRICFRAIRCCPIPTGLGISENLFTTTYGRLTVSPISRNSDIVMHSNVS